MDGNCAMLYLCVGELGWLALGCRWERNMVSCIVRTTVLRENSEVVMCYSVGKSELASVLSVFLSVQMQ